MKTSIKLNTLFTGYLFVILLVGCEGGSDIVFFKNKDTNQSADTINYIAVGKKIAVETQGILAKNLVEAIGKGGTENAIAFCNISAISLTDSMAGILNADVKRVTDKPRNAINIGNDNELNLMQHLKNKVADGEALNDTIMDGGNSVTGYYPIITNAMCLQCHGKPETDINAATYEKLQQLYPEDKATGYTANELRGLWKVTMKKKNTL
jgi:hypothetical protein